MNRTLLLLFAGTLLAATQSNSAPLKAGDSIPDLKLRTETNQEVSLPRHSSDLVGIEQDLENPRPDTEITSIDFVSAMIG